MVNRKIIDAHIHWWDLDSNLYPWLNGKTSQVRDVKEAKNLANNYLPNDFLSDAKRYDVLAVVHVEAGFDPTKPVDETKWLNNLKASVPFVAVGSVNLSHDNADDLLYQHCKYNKIRSIRHMLNYMGDNPQYCWAEKDYLNNDVWLKNYGLLEKYNLIFDLMCFGHQMKRFSEVAKQHPCIPVVLEHTGMPSSDSISMNQWKDGIKILAQCENINCKLGGLSTMIPKWDKGIAFDLFDWVLECFGVDRIMFSSNFPTDSQFCTFDYLMGITEEWASMRLTEDEQHAFFAGNANRIYRIF